MITIGTEIIPKLFRLNSSFITDNMMIEKERKNLEQSRKSENHKKKKDEERRKNNK